MNYNSPVNTKIVDMIGKLEEEGQLPATYLYKNESQQRTLRYLIDNGFVTETKIPHTLLRLIDLTDKGRRLSELLSEINELFPPGETTTYIQTGETVEESEEEDGNPSEKDSEDTISNEIKQMTLEDSVDD